MVPSPRGAVPRPGQVVVIVEDGPEEVEVVASPEESRLQEPLPANPTPFWTQLRHINALL